MIFNDIKQYISQKMQYIDRTYWMLFIALILVAIIALFSASSFFVFQEGNSTLGAILSQMLYIALGVALAFGLQFVPSKWIRLLGYIGLIVSFVLLLLTFTSLGVEVNGATRWIEIFGITFQPSELAKLTLIIVVSDLLSRIKTQNDQRKYFGISIVITLIICGIIFIGNLSTAGLLGGIVILLAILARVHIKYWGSLVVAITAFLICGYFFINEAYVKPNREMKDGSIMERAITWVKRINRSIEEKKIPDAEFRITDENYQRSHAQIAIARGGKSPVGVLPGNSIQRDILPQAFADYIFAIIVEESGIIGAIGLIFLYLSILFRACLKSSRYADFSAMLMVMGLALMITCQALISMMVSVGLGPVTGQPLPMISRGGTSAIITSIYFGIIMSVSREQTELGARQQAVINESRDEVPDIVLD